MSYRTRPNHAAARDPAPSAEPTPDVSRAHRERDAAHRARGAAETARDRAEDARDAAESATDGAMAELEHLREDVVFLREQLRSTRAHVAEALEPEIAELHAERDALLQEMGTLEAELQGRAASPSPEPDEGGGPHDDGAGHARGDAR